MGARHTGTASWLRIAAAIAILALLPGTAAGASCPPDAACAMPPGGAGMTSEAGSLEAHGCCESPSRPARDAAELLAAGGCCGCSIEPASTPARPASAFGPSQRPPLATTSALDRPAPSPARGRSVNQPPHAPATPRYLAHAALLI